MNWKSFLKQIFLDDGEVLEFVQRLVGYAASGDKTLRLIPVCHGEFPSGKTTFFRALSLVMKAELMPVLGSIFDLSHSLEHPSPDLMPLRDAKIVVFSDFPPLRKDVLSSRLKMLAADEDVTARALYSPEPSVFRNAATPFLVVQEIPRTLLRDKALAARCVFIPFLSNLTPGIRDPFILGNIAFDVAGIRAWLDAGIYLWKQEGLSIPQRFLDPNVGGRRAA